MNTKLKSKRVDLSQLGQAIVSQADKNPTWTIMALSMRTSEYIAQQMKARQL